MHLNSRQQILRDFVLLGVLTSLACVLGIRQLPKYDLGWHLAAGLWTIENGWVPTVDPFGAESSFWLCYSWLPELVIAYLYQLSGFTGLQVVQALNIIAAFCCYFFFVRALRNATPTLQRHRHAAWIELIAIITLLLFSSPILYLRPQLYSLLFCAVLLLLAETKRLQLSFLAPLMIIWVNVHILWVLVPIILLLYRARPRVLLATTCLALINPYTWRMFEGVFRYLFEHRQAYDLITEFQRLSPQQGFLFWLFVTAVVLVLGKGDATLLREKGKRPLFVFWLGAALASILRIKFLPFFGLATAVLFIRAIAPSLSTIRSGEKPEQEFKPSSTRSWIFAAGLALVFVVTTVSFIELPTPLPDEERELLQIAEELSRSSCDGTTVVFNHFNNGGWLALGFYLARPSGAKNSGCRTAIDGRSLVMGERRLSEYQQIFERRADWCEVFKRWAPQHAILKNPQDFSGCGSWTASSEVTSKVFKLMSITK